MFYFTSDTHYFHNNIIRYCNRPWETIEAMNAGLIENHNAVVGKDDTVIHIGDFAMGPKATRYSIIPQLNGKIILVRGNHDEAPISKLKEFGFYDVVSEYVHIDPKHGEIFCQHVPNLKNDYKYHFCGHVHQQWMHLKPNVINVGVDVRGYKPVTADELINSFLMSVQTQNTDNG